MNDSRALLRVVIDTREQCPWSFAKSSVIVVASRKLRVGDYAPEGFESAIAIERKTLDDLVNSMFAERDRFVAELEILSTYSYAAVIVEANVDDVLLQTYRSKIPPARVLEEAARISVRLRVPVLFTGSRRSAAMLAESLMRHAIDAAPGVI